jgi:DNA-binding transcriptional ArsR family regulator
MNAATDPNGELPGGWPAWFDPTQDHLLTPRRLRGLLHPIRVRLLGLLESDGPATASQLARRIGESSGVTSYHLRILAEHDFIEDDEQRSNGRDRWWKPKYRGTAFTFRSPDDPIDREGVEAGAQYMRILAEDYHRRMVAFIDSLSSRMDELHELPWTFSDSKIELTTEEGRALAAEITALVERYRRKPGERRPGDGVRPGFFQFQMLPDMTLEDADS